MTNIKAAALQPQAKKVININRLRKELKIVQPKRCIIVEKMVTDANGTETILKGSNLNCGACGGHLGIMTSDLTFPFTLQAFKSRVKYSQFLTGAFGFKCKRKKCRAVLFSELRGLVFTSIENFKKTQLVAVNERVGQLVEQKKRVKRIKRIIFFVQLFRKIKRRLLQPFKWLKTKLKTIY